MTWTPTIEVKSNQGTREISLRSHLLSQRTILLTEEITDETAVTFLTELSCLKESDEPVRILINSMGGSVSAGLMIYDLIHARPCPMDLYCAGTAASMAAILLAAGPKGHRFILPHSTTMIHEPQIADCAFGGSASSIRNLSDKLMQMQDLTNQMLAECTGRPIREINKATAYDHFMNAQESVEFGICDEVVEDIFRRV